MYKFGGLIVSVLAISSAFGARIPVSASDPLVEVKEIIRQANVDLANENKSVVSIKDVSESHWYGRIAVSGIRAGNFSTIALVGDEQVFTQKLVDDSAVYSFELQIGFEDLYIEGAIYYSFLLPIVDSNIRIANGKENNLALRVEGTITANSDGSCEASMASAKVSGLDQLEVTLRAGGITSFIQKYIVQFLFGHFSPQLESTINSELSDSIKTSDFKTHFNKLACTPFQI